MSDPPVNGLNHKMELLATQLATQHTELMEVLSGIATSVNQLTVGLVGPDSLLGYLELIQNNTFSAATSLVGVQQMVSPTPDQEQATLWTLTSRIGTNTTPGGDLATVVEILNAIYARRSLNDLYERMGVIMEGLGLFRIGVIGDGSDPTDIRTYVARLAACADCPELLLPDCADPFKSSGSVIDQSTAEGPTTNIKVATFAGDLPEGIHYVAAWPTLPISTQLAFDDPGSWRVLVKSSAGAYSKTPLGVYDNVTNEWSLLTSADEEVIFSVPEGDTLEVWLCLIDVPDPPDPRTMQYEDIAVSTTTDAGCEAFASGSLVNGFTVSAYAPKVRVEYISATTNSSAGGHTNGTVGPMSVQINGSEIGQVSVGDDVEFETEGGTFQIRTTQLSQCSANLRVWWYDEPLP